MLVKYMVRINLHSTISVCLIAHRKYLNLTHFVYSLFSCYSVCALFTLIEIFLFLVGCFVVSSTKYTKE